MASQVSNLVSSVTSYWSSKESFEVLSQEKEILRIGNILNSIFLNRNEIEIPHMVVVGSQSSGKSSILNSILGMDILPTGTNMVTRCPIQLELIQSKTEVKACFGTYEATTWTPIKDVQIRYPNPTIEQRNDILNTIQEITQKNAGSNMNISFIPIHIRIYSPNIPNLSLIDLPGLTMVACTDQGQPKNIKEQIRQLIGKYIEPKSSIILAVMPARPDIEADIALDLIKEYDPNGERTIGILTKVDLMNDGTDITNLLDGRVSKDLQLSYGYYAIRNRNKVEMETKTVMDGLQLEYEWFSKHPVYNQMKYKEHLGIPYLCKNLSTILVRALKKSFPSILQNINHSLDKHTKELELLGNTLPNDDAHRLSYIHSTIAQLTRNFISILEERGKNIHTGRNIKQFLIELRTKMYGHQPFSAPLCPDSYIETMIANCDGNHMSVSISPIEVLELMIKDTNFMPLRFLYDLTKEYIQKIMNSMNELLMILLKDMKIDRYPNFIKFIQTTILNDVLLINIKKTHENILNEILAQECYIWTDNKLFIDEVNKHNDSQTNMSINKIRSVANTYYKCILDVLQDTIPKKIMLFLIQSSEKMFSNVLYEKVKSQNINQLVHEYEEVYTQRQQLDKTVKELMNSKQLIESIL
jgi:dynamin 1-like protein